MADREQLVPEGTGGYAAEAERHVIGRCLLDEADAATAAAELKASDFSDGAIAETFSAILDALADGQGGTLPDVAPKLAGNGKLDVAGGVAALAEWMEDAKFSAPVEKLIPVVRSNSGRFQLSEAGKAIIALSEKADPYEDLLARAQDLVFSLNTKDSPDEVDLRSIAPRVASRMIDPDAPDPRVSWMIDELDNKVRGMSPTGLYVVGARPGTGKSSFLYQMSGRLALVGGKHVAFFSLEAPREDVLEVLAKMHARVDNLKRPEALTDDESSRLQSSLQLIVDSGKLHLFDDPEMNVASIISQCRLLAAKGMLGIVMIDYLQLVTLGDSSVSSRTEEVQRITRQCKKLAMSLEVPVIVASQLNRQMANGPQGAREPELSDLRECGSIEQDANGVLLLHRPRMDDTKVMWLFKKNRHGPQARIQMHFYGPQQRFVTEGQLVSLQGGGAGGFAAAPPVMN